MCPSMMKMEIVQWMMVESSYRTGLVLHAAPPTSLLSTLTQQINVGQLWLASSTSMTRVDL